MKNNKTIAIFVVAVVNLIAQIYIYLLHAGNLDTTGIEAVKELTFTPIILSVLIFPGLFFKQPFKKLLINFFALSGFALTIIIAATHSGARSAVSLLDRPQYIVGILALAAIISLNSVKSLKGK